MEFEIDPVKMIAVVWFLVTFSYFSAVFMFAQARVETYGSPTQPVE